MAPSSMRPNVTSGFGGLLCKDMVLCFQIGSFRGETFLRNVSPMRLHVSPMLRAVSGYRYNYQLYRIQRNQRIRRGRRFSLKDYLCDCRKVAIPKSKGNIGTIFLEVACGSTSYRPHQMARSTITL